MALCQPAYGTCNRDEGHTGKHSQLTEEQYQAEIRQEEKRLIEHYAKMPYCSKPLSIQVFDLR